jgi:hypothetical protein
MKTVRENHPSFDWDVPADAALWRYLDFPKLVSMLNEKALYFSRADLLGDPLEGSFTQALEVARRAHFENPPEGRTQEDLHAAFQQHTRLATDNRRKIYINCWHCGDHESMALWKGYGGGPYAVAIRTTFGRGLIVRFRRCPSGNDTRAARRQPNRHGDVRGLQRESRARLR